MTALNILLEPRRVCVAMDTLVARRGHPWRFTSKIFPLPHLDGALCGTGALRFITDWFLQLQIEVLAPDLVTLDRHVPGALRLLARDHYLDEGNTTTIYHFGLDPARGEFRGFAYRSARGFRSEELPRGLLVKPPLDGTLDAPGPEALAELMERQKAEDRALPPRDRVGIGGEVHLLTLTPGRYELRRCRRFADYPEDYRAMLGE
jgi:hypothetical protein